MGNKPNVAKSAEKPVENADKDLKEYTLEEVEKHNKESDAWLVVNGYVADVTAFIPDHPGGKAILDGLGKDATPLFEDVGHSETAKELFLSFRIGKLVKHHAHHHTPAAASAKP